MSNFLEQMVAELYEYNGFFIRLKGKPWVEGKL